jgi:hypothetical protein
MKIECVPNVPEAPAPPNRYPWIGQREEDGCIVLFVGPKAGLLLLGVDRGGFGSGTFHVGELGPADGPLEGFWEDEFEPYDGHIVLTND